MWRWAGDSEPVNVLPRASEAEGHEGPLQAAGESGGPALIQTSLRMNSVTPCVLPGSV